MTNTTATLHFDLKGTSLPTDGALNPAWVKASESFDVIGGDIGAAGIQRVAIHTVDDGRYYGRDYLGRAVVLTEVASAN